MSTNITYNAKRVYPEPITFADLQNFSPSPPNYTTDKNLSKFQKSSANDYERYSTFQDALSTCFVCNMHPYQAVSEFRDEFGCEPPPQYFRQWRRCWDELDITPEKVTAWLKEVDATGWIQRLGGAR